MATTRDGFLRLFRYEHWANRRVLDSLEARPEGDGAVRLFSHILSTREVWLARMKDEDPDRIPVWAERDVAQCREALERGEKTIESYMESLTEADLDRTFTYRNTQGQAFENTIGEALTHLVFHSHYHRGQVASRLRDSGAEPVNTDFIVFVREGFG